MQLWLVSPRVLEATTIHVVEETEAIEHRTDERFGARYNRQPSGCGERPLTPVSACPDALMLRNPTIAAGQGMQLNAAPSSVVPVCPATTTMCLRGKENGHQQRGAEIATVLKT